MNILLLAPHPFYQDRGTPIAVDLLLRVFCERGDHVDVVTYNEGRSVEYPNVTINRTPSLFFLRNIGPGFSWRKLVCDFFMCFKVLRLALKNRYQVVHSVEESVFMALVLQRLLRVPYVYDMDSSMAEQLVEKFPRLASLSVVLNFLEGLAIKKSEAVVPVCDAVARIAERHHPKRIVVLPDVSLLKGKFKNIPVELKKQLGIEGLVMMYIGNLEAYQGIDLLLESFVLTVRNVPKPGLVIIGGSARHIHDYQEKCLRMGIASHVHFLGPKPVDDLEDYLSEADILVSPRVKGKNTPMKIYSYLHSGKAVLATDLPTHTQVLDNQVAVLAAPRPEEFSKGMLCLMKNEALRLQLGEAGWKLIKERYSYHSFKEKLSNLYDSLERELVRGVGAK
jgi:glycosyltransferase involved in cell wall biosynthesis